MSNLLLSVDVGTTAIKAGCFTPEGQLIASAYCEYPLEKPKKYWVEQDADHWLKLSKEMLSAVIKSSAVDREDIIAMSISAQGISFVPTDFNGFALRKAFSWLDTRAVKQTQEITNIFNNKETAFRTLGIHILPTYTLPKILWMKENQPDIFVNTYKFSTSLDFLNKHFVGKFITDYSIAGGMLAHNLQQMNWDKELLKLLDIPLEKFPSLDWSGTLLGDIKSDIAKEIGLPKNVKLVLGGHDQECAALGAGVSNGDISISMGTASILIAPTDVAIIDPKLRIPSYPHVEENQFVLEAVVSAAGVSFRWIKDLFNTISRNFSYDYDDLVDLALQTPPGSNGIKFFPHLSGATCPFWNPKSTGMVLGISLDTSKSEFTRSLLEGWCYQLKTNLNVIEELTGRRENIFVFGGGAKNQKLLQILADILGKPIRISATSETALLGAAMLAGLGAGVYSNLADAKTNVRKEGKVIENDMAVSRIYQSLYEDYRFIEDQFIGMNYCTKENAI
ncbi:MAG: hypothetical protein GX660_20125 [Clostridiaceae bacterium]|nr:hypothetical protein [Clostridiaceae bacterium]